MPKPRRISRLALLIGSLACAYWLGTLSRAEVHATGANPEPYPELLTLARVLSHIERNYVDPVDDRDLLYTGIKAMVRSLDPHSNFLTPEEFAAMREDTRGEYVGVGMEVGLRDGRVTVIAPFEGGPAFEAGIETGDVILQIDGDSMYEAGVEEVTRRLRGEQGDPVTVLVRRQADDGSALDLEFTLVRDMIHVVAVESRMLTTGYGYIRVRTFQAGVTEDVVTALDELTVENGAELAGLVLDMRNNPGGLLNEAVSLSDLFIDSGLVVSTEGRDTEENHRYESSEGATRYRGELTVLVNGGTASASEIVAGALQDHERALIMGRQSFGKGTVQSIIDFDDGSGLKLTTARYFTPDHRSIHGAGITPDIEVGEGEMDPEHNYGARDLQILSALDVLMGRPPRSALTPVSPAGATSPAPGDAAPED
jgi:carboxyl-terminal processing protease